MGQSEDQMGANSSTSDRLVAELRAVLKAGLGAPSWGDVEHLFELPSVAGETAAAGGDRRVGFERALKSALVQIDHDLYRDAITAHFGLAGNRYDRHSARLTTALEILNLSKDAYAKDRPDRGKKSRLTVLLETVVATLLGPTPQSASESPPQPMARAAAHLPDFPVSPQPALPRAALLCALPLEYAALRHHLQDVRSAQWQGSYYEVGRFADAGRGWEVLIHETGAGNTRAAAATERVLSYFKPEVAAFVGVAGGIAEKGVRHGDVIVATEVHHYHSGKAGKEFAPRPKSARTDHGLQEDLRAVARHPSWAGVDAGPGEVNLRLAPIVSGEHLVNSNDSETLRLIRQSYEDSVAVEMEGYGFLEATTRHRGVRSMVLRGISDLIGDKTASADAEWQPLAAKSAAAAAFQMLDRATTEFTVAGQVAPEPFEHEFASVNPPREPASRDEALVAVGSDSVESALLAGGWLVADSLHGGTGSPLLSARIRVHGHGRKLTVETSFGLEAKSILLLAEVRDLAAYPGRLLIRVLSDAFALRPDAYAEDEAPGSTPGIIGRVEAADELVTRRRHGTVDTARAAQVLEHLVAGHSVGLVGQSASGKTVTAAQVCAQLQRVGWSITWLDVGNPAVSDLDALVSSVRQPVGSAGHHLFVLDDLQGNPGLGAQLAEMLERITTLSECAVQKLVLSWDSRTVQETGFGSVKPIPCRGFDVLPALVQGLSGSELEDGALEQLRELSRGDLLVARLAMDHWQREGSWPSPLDLARAAYQRAIGDAPLPAEALRLAYELGSLGQFEVEATRAFAETSSPDGLGELVKRGVLRPHGHFVSLGHRSLATLITAHLLRTAGDDLENLPGPARLTVDYLRVAGDRQIMAMLERLDLAAIAAADADQHGTAFLARAWESLRVLSSHLARRSREDVGWGDNVASAVFAARTFARFEPGEWSRAAAYVRNRWEVGVEGQLPCAVGEATTERVDFTEIARRMEEQDSGGTDGLIAAFPANSIDYDEVHRTWVLGLLLGFEADAPEPDHERIRALKRAAEEHQDPEGAFFPPRVPWVTARVLMGLAAVGESVETSPVVARACAWLRRPHPEGPYRFGAWESGTGTWNSSVMTTAMCLSALVQSGVPVTDPAVRAGVAYLMSNREHWLAPGQEIDAAEAIETYLLTGGRWRDVSGELMHLLTWARDREPWAHAFDLASESQDESSKVPAVASALIGIVWATVKQELPLLLEGVAMEVEDILRPGHGEDETW